MAIHHIPGQVGPGEREAADPLSAVPPQTVARHAPVPGAPWLPRGYLPRRVLWSRLSVSTLHAVTMVVAPAGAGKSLGVAGWLQHSSRGRHATWVSADRSTGAAELEALLDGAAPGPDGSPTLVVIDDAHQLPAAAVRHLDARLSTDPDRMRVVLLTRWDLAVSRLVPELLGHLTVLRGDVLRLTDDETVRLVAQHARSDSAELCEAIMDRADGWCAAVVMAARASAAAPSTADFVRRCRTTGPGVADLVAGEVFAALRPRERHLLLCTAAEPFVTHDIAVHLTRDPGAGEVLASLELTGLLVSRAAVDQHDEHDAAADRFRIHPLLLEVARRRVAAGGVDVQQAHGTVLRAARLDLTRGQTALGFRRLLALGEDEEAARLLATEGPALLAQGERDGVVGLVRRAGPAVEHHPEIWATLAWAHWAKGDDDAAEHWAQRLVRLTAADPTLAPESHVACVRLHRSRSGAEPVEDAVAATRALIARDRSASGRDPFRPLLLLELGVAENWLGDLVEAEQDLSEAALLSRSRGLAAPAAEALSHLALTQYMAGRERAGQDLALEVLAGDGGRQDATSSTTRQRAELVRDLVALQSLPWAGAPATPATPTHAGSAPDDLASRFWLRVLAARSCLVGGSVAEAQRCLDHPFESPPPLHLRVILLAERAVIGLITGNRDVLRRVAAGLADLQADGERAWVRGALADLDGDPVSAAALYVEAAGADCRAQPATAALSLVCAAQLQDYLGDHERAQVLLTEAVTLTASRQHAAPFLGWSTQGTRVGQLLADDSVAAASSAWGGALQAACADRASVISMLRPRVATPHELSAALAPVLTPLLSPREQQVLTELARGSTYADIASNLFVSENTVKTHISSLYSKLAVGRRSEALAVARKLHLV